MQPIRCAEVRCTIDGKGRERRKEAILAELVPAL